MESTAEDGSWSGGDLARYAEGTGPLSREYRVNPYLGI
jgi:hypothetical protein